MFAAHKAAAQNAIRIIRRNYRSSILSLLALKQIGHEQRSNVRFVPTADIVGAGAAEYRSQCGGQMEDIATPQDQPTLRSV